MGDLKVTDIFGRVIEKMPIEPNHTAGSLRPGLYRRTEDGEIFRVRLNQPRTRLYTQRWTRRGNRYEFVYDPKALATLTADDLLPLDEARDISRQAGQCLACARLLTDPASQAAGIGPVCAEKWTYAQAQSTLPADVAMTPRKSVRARIEGDRIVITSRYDDVIIAIIKTFPGNAWDERNASWSLPREHALALAEAFEATGITHDDLVAIAMGWVA